MKPPSRSPRSDSVPMLDARTSGKSDSLLYHVPVSCLILDSTGVILEANLETARLLGTEISCLKGMSLREFILDGDREKFALCVEHCQHSREKNSVELRLSLPGAPLVELISSVSPSSRTGKVCLQTVIYEHAPNGNKRTKSDGREEDIRRLNRTLQALSKSSQAMTRAVDQISYMNDVCEIVQKDCGHAMVWIGFALDDEQKSIQPVAYAGFEEGYLETLKLTWADSERGRGPTGTAVRTGQPSLCRNMLTDPRFAPWRQDAIRRGYASSIALPLIEGTKTFGAVTVYSRETDPFSEDEVKLLSELADDLAYGLAALRLRSLHEAAEQSLRASEERHRALFESMTEGFALHEIITDSHGTPCDYRFLEINPAFEKLTGLKRADLLGKRVLEVLPGNEPVWIETYGRVALTGEPMHFENFSTPLNRWYEVFAYRPAPLQFAAIFTDITSRKRAEEERNEVEARVRRKLQNVLMPEGDLGELELGDLIDVPAMQRLMNDFYAVAQFPMSLTDMKGKVLVGVGWQDICTGFHRVHPETCKLCTESDTQLSAGVLRGEFRLYRCKNNLWDIATPVVVGGKQVGNIFSGQFFFEDEDIDQELFRNQAKRYGFDEDQYLAALERVPRLSRATVDRGMAFLLKLADTLSDLGYSNAKLARLLGERDRLTASLHEEQERLKLSQGKYQALTETTSDFIWEMDAQGRYTYCSPQMESLWGMKPGEMVGKTPFDVMPPEEVEKSRALFLTVAKASQPFSGLESTAYDSQGRLVHLETSGVPFHDEEGNLLGFRGISRDITERKRAEQEAQRGTQRFALLSETASALLASANPQTVIEELCRKVMTHLDCDIFFNFLVDENAQCLRLNACGGIAAKDLSKVQRLDFGVAVCGRVAREKRRAIVEDIQHIPDDRTQLVRSFGVQAYCCHPLMAADRVLGTLSFGSRGRPRFTGDEIELMRVVADQVSVALERIRTEKAQRESEERLQEALRVSRSFAFEWVPATDRVHRSLSCSTLLGLTGEEAEEDTGEKFFQRLDPADRETFVRTVRGLTPQADRYEIKYRLMRPDGGITILEESGRGTFDSAGKLLRVIGITTDVTARERAEEALRDLNARLEQRVEERTAALKRSTEALDAERKRFMDVLDVLPAYVILLSADYRVPFANRYFEERFGKSQGHRCYEYLFGRTEPCEVCETFRTLRENAPVKWEWTGPDGRMYDVSDFPFTDTDGSKLVLEMGIDVTERVRAEAELEKHRHHLETLVAERTSQLSAANVSLQNEIADRKEAEEALQESEERFRLAIQHSKLMAWQCDRDMRFTWVYNSHFGVPDDQLLGKSPADLGFESGMQEFIAHGREVLARGTGTREIVKHVHADNREGYFDQQIETVRDAHGGIVGLIGISLDVTERVLAEQRLHKSEESFRLMVAHSVEPMLLVNESGGIECISRMAAEQLGYQDTQLLGTSIERFLDWSGKLDLTMRLDDFLRHAPVPARAVLRVRTGAGFWCWIDLEASFVNYGQNPQKYLLKFELINTDIPK